MHWGCEETKRRMQELVTTKTTSKPVSVSEEVLNGTYTLPDGSADSSVLALNRAPRSPLMKRTSVVAGLSSSSDMDGTGGGGEAVNPQ